MRKSKTPAGVITAILTLITILVWAGFSVYRSLTTKPEAPVPSPIINPLNPTLDTQSLDQIGARIFVSDQNLPNTSPIPAPTPIQTSSPTPVGTPFETTAPSQTP